MAKPPQGSKPKATTAPKDKDERSQRERFIETARAIGVDESGAEFEAALAKLAPPKRRRAL
jgi:hypothetical protein